MIRSLRARDNGDTLVRFIQAYVEGLRRSMHPANRGAALAKALVPADLAERSYEVAVDPQNGFMPDAKVDLPGFGNVLKLGAELHGDWGGRPPSPERYLDLSHHRRAVVGLN